MAQPNFWHISRTHCPSLFASIHSATPQRVTSPNRSIHHVFVVLFPFIQFKTFI
jgi:hypothetical protein